MTDTEQKSIKLEILGRSYALKVVPGDEKMMQDAAAFINERYKEYRQELKGQPDYTINAMALLSIAVDLFQEKSKSDTADELEDGLAETKQKLLKILGDIEHENDDI